MQTAPAPLHAVATRGARIILADGRELVDGISSWWTACHGYNHPHIRSRVMDQLQRMPHVMLGGLVHEPAESLAQRLAELLPGMLNHVFFSESGSVSVDVAMKMAVQFWLNQGVRNRSGFLSFRHGYHGDTIGAMSVCDPEEGMHGMFAGLLPRQLIVDLPRTREQLDGFERLLDEQAQTLAGVIMEPLVQAAGGMKFHSKQTLAAIADACHRHDLLLILDEIATGFGRTGSMFACEQANVTPDIITLSKALTGGTMPLAATVATDRVYDGFLSDSFDTALMHGPTYSGNPLACAAAHASLDLFQMEPRLAQVAQLESALEEGLAECRHMAGVADVRVKGAIGVVELSGHPDLDQLRQRFAAAGVWVRPLENVVYLMPPFIISPDELATLTAAVREVVATAGVAAGH
jgi:adenosylmethionine-8-amino-7-oxononanoate aminotransferase